uniref:B-cell receptor CD22 n=1 Tax=Mastacembelus armatus TaxID=205130 RepID=A0A7N8YHZ2_9TELE
IVLISAVLCVTAVRGHWAVTYTSTQVCAIKGSTVNIQCSYRYPSRIQGHDTVVQKEFWQTTIVPEDLTTRVQYQCEDKTCTLTIRDLRETDSAQYNFRFITNQPGGKYSGSPGVTLTVRDAPKLLSVSVSPSAEIVEGSSLTLTCSSDANPAAKHTWYKRNHTLLSKEPQLLFNSIQSTDSGEYYCTAENDLGKTTSGSIFIHVACESNTLTVPAVFLAFMLLPAWLWIRSAVHFLCNYICRTLPMDKMINSMSCVQCFISLFVLLLSCQKTDVIGSTA